MSLTRSRLSRVVVAGVTLSGLLVAGGVPAFAQGQRSLAAAPDDDPSSKFQKSETRGPVGTDFRPLSVGADGHVTVVVEMKGDPVAVVQAEKGSELTTAERNSVKTTLKKAQDAIAGSIQSKGGKIEATMQSAYNGIQVSIPAEQVDAVAALPNVVAVHAVQDVLARQRGLGAVPRRAAGVAEHRLHGRERQGRDHRHRNRLHARQLRRPRHARGVRPRPTPPRRSPPIRRSSGRTRRASRAATTSSATPTTPTIDAPAFRSPTPTRSTATGTAATWPARPRAAASRPTAPPTPGPYDASTPSKSFDIGPGVAPQADLYALRVFGCDGSTNVIVPAIDWAVDNGMDVINMSLGSPLRQRRRPGRGRRRRTLSAPASSSWRRRATPARAPTSPAPATESSRSRQSTARRASPAPRSPSGGVAIPAINANGADLPAFPA